MSRLFDGVDDQMVYPAPATLSGALTMLIVVKFATSSGWISLLEGETSGGADRATIGRNPDQSNNLYFSNGVAGLPTGGVTLTNTSNWYVAALQRASGTVAARTHLCQVGAVSNTHTDHVTSMANASSIAGGNLRIGGNADFGNIRVAAAAIWNSNPLVDADFEGIASDATTQSIADLSPVWLVDDSDAFATDLIGSNDRTSITGTADDADDPSGWVYGLGGGAAATSLPPVQPYRQLSNVFSR